MTPSTPVHRPSEEQAVLAPLLALLAALGERDAEAMRRTLLPGGHATIVRDGQATLQPFEAFVERLSQPGPERREEPVHDVLVHVAGDIAVVWAPYRFLADGRLRHMGTDVAQMVRVDGRWLIANLAFDVQARPGPPLA